MRLPEPLIPGKFIRRYKRFLADIELASGDVVTVHCANPGSMKSLLHVGADVLLSVSDNPKRKLPYTWELIRIDGSWVGVNTLRTNCGQSCGLPVVQTRRLHRCGLRSDVTGGGCRRGGNAGLFNATPASGSQVVPHNTI